MYPTIREGEYITVVPVRTNEVHKTDVLLCTTDRGPLVHRVHQICGESPESLLLRGDASTTCDDAIHFQQVLGKVISTERQGRKIPVRGRIAITVLAVRRIITKMKSLGKSVSNYFQSGKQRVA
jgi:hypothetical protein